MVLRGRTKESTLLEGLSAAAPSHRGGPFQFGPIVFNRRVERNVFNRRVEPSTGTGSVPRGLLTVGGSSQWAAAAPKKRYS